MIACGQCYSWAYREVQESGGTLVHGTVSEPFAHPPHQYDHAWVERRGKVYDWQTMEAHHGGKFSGNGYPKKIFYELFKPTRMTRYSAAKAMDAIVKSRGGIDGGGMHYGPWGADVKLTPAQWAERVMR